MHKRRNPEQVGIRNRWGTEVGNRNLENYYNRNPGAAPHLKKICNSTVCLIQHDGSANQDEKTAFQESYRYFFASIRTETILLGCYTCRKRRVKVYMQHVREMLIVV